jgi:magnesium transporter
MTEISTTPELLYLLVGDPQELAETVAQMRAADVAEALNDLTPEASAMVLATLPFDMAVQVVDQPELLDRPEIFKRLDTNVAAALIEAMSADEQADLFGEMSESERERLTRVLDPDTRAALRMLLRYPEHTAGGIMTTEFVSVPANWTVQQVLDHVEEVGKAKETIYAIYVLQPGTRQLERVVGLRELIGAEPTSRVGDVADPRKPVTVAPLMDREDVARLISKYNLLAVPVVDEQMRMLGIVTVDDVIDALVTELTEDVQKFGGMEALEESYTQIGFFSMVRKRAGWLSALFLSEMLTTTAMAHFEGEISRAVVLALFIPLVMSSGGNSGSQATSLIIRAMALREVELHDWWRVALRELPSGIALGSILGAIGFVRVLTWQFLGWYDYGPHYVLVATTIGLALIGIVTWGSLAGSMLPFLMRRIGFDPASASAPFVATLVDVTGIVIYFSVAYLILHGTLL